MRVAYQTSPLIRYKSLISGIIQGVYDLPSVVNVVWDCGCLVVEEMSKTRRATRCTRSFFIHFDRYTG